MCISYFLVGVEYMIGYHSTTTTKHSADGRTDEFSVHQTLLTEITLLIAEFCEVKLPHKNCASRVWLTSPL
jgi:hypothetical protein